MIRNVIASMTGVIAIVGAIGSAISLLYILGYNLQVSEITISLLSVAVGLIGGLFNTYVVKFVKKFRTSPRVFIGYSHADQPVALEVAELLRKGGARVWLDLEQIIPGESIQRSIEEGIGNADVFIALLSGKTRSYLLSELNIAKSKGLKVIPVILSDSEIPLELIGIGSVDLRHDRNKGLRKLVRAVT